MNSLRRLSIGAVIAIMIGVGWASRLRSQESSVSASIGVDSIGCGVTHHAVLAALGRLPKRGPVYPYPLPPNTDAAVTATANETNDAEQDIEPTVSTITVSGITSTVTAFIKYVNSGTTPRLYYTRTTDDVTYSGGALAVPAGYTYTADPYLAQNPNNSGAGPHQLSLVGTAFNGPINNPNAIYLWRSTDGGASWLTPVQVTADATSRYYYDKPNITVSQYAGTLGKIYVIYTRTDLQQCSGNFCGDQIVMRRSDDGGATFTSEVALTGVSLTTSVGGPQVVAATAAARIYGIWADYPAGAIRLSSSDDWGGTWTAAAGNPTGRNLMGPINNGGAANYYRYPLYPPDQTNHVVAYTLPSARFNAAANKVSIVWQERSADGIYIDVYYAAKIPGGWQGPVRVNQVASKDQFNPALDLDTSGNLLVTYYSTANDPYFNDLYQSYFTRIDSSGSVLQSDTTIATFFSDPSSLTSFQYFLGDYQDAWFDGAQWRSVWVGIPSSSHADIFLSRIQ
jgi:hypothetical protein